jgi:ribose transport system substrate-binding protein
VSKRVAKTTVAALALASLIAACGDNGNDATTSGNVASGGASASGGTGGASAEVKAAADKVTAFKKEPDAIPVTQPLKAKPAAGKTFVWMKCDVGQCTQEGEGIKEAAEAIGWTYKEIPYKSADPATLVTALQDALRLKPAAVALSGLPRAVWESAAKQYSEAKIPVILGYVGGGDNVKDPVIGEIGGDKDVSEYADMIAQWFIADSQGKGQAALLSVNDFPVLKTFSDTFKKSVSAGCAACKVTEVNATIPQVFAGQTVQPIISAIQKDPKTNYVITSNMPFVTGISGQLSAAGLQGKVKVAGESADVEGLTLLKAGTYNATTGLALHYTGWAFVDMALRSIEGTTFEAGDGGLPKQLLTPDVSFDLSTSYDKPGDFREQFKKLWKVG